MTYKIAALYKFTPVQDIPALRAAIYDFAETCEGMCGTLLLAPEGVNGTIGAKPGALDRMIDFLDQHLGIKSGELKYSESAESPFNKFKVRPKKEIITMRAPEADPNVDVGDYVEVSEWDDLINDPDMTLIDTRNDYETKVGIFRGAIDPNLKTFTDFKDYVEKNLDPAAHKKVAMYCTGGIRCEKASSYMKAKGFENVYHLKGGILKYLEEVPAEKSSWDGECFVFDKRVAVGHGLSESSDWTICHGCREPLSQAETKRDDYELGVSCLHCIDDLDDERAAMLRQRQAYYEKSREAV
jgi:UPF0176 protein